MSTRTDPTPLERWELYRAEMMDSQDRLAKVAADFLSLGAFEDAARVSMRCAAMKHFIGRMPPLAATQPDGERP